MNESIVLEGERVRLVPLEQHHAEVLYEAGRYEEIWTYLPIVVNTLDDMRNWIEAALVRKGQGYEYPFVVFDKETNVCVGSTRYMNIDLHNRGLEVGWTWYTPALWRSRVNTECKYLLLQYAFEQLHLVRVQLKADTRNERSNQAITRIGAIREGILRQDRVLPDGYIRNAYIYSILNKEWPDVKQRLEQYLERSN
ncbi:GNAT family N-acetyltransferase [Paenibacillus sp. SC116]|uniref:GNAT family N-acetyltransferase n=1 Tax=Paenibacillus sp. SC116 TaxID=2968986 RepID=UPI00215AC2AB|nr:GNAT family N-acetyltransferase [Paenibacillus sp. SC116]MCR8845875.1 GNAT family N-acetyltransferase [Paenibacillus sp. SC116]